MGRSLSDFTTSGFGSMMRRPTEPNAERHSRRVPRTTEGMTSEEIASERSRVHAKQSSAQQSRRRDRKRKAATGRMTIFDLWK